MNSDMSEAQNSTARAMLSGTGARHAISAEIFSRQAANLMRAMNHPRLGLTVDRNNRRFDDDTPNAPIDPNGLPRYIDRYDAVARLIPFAN